MSARSSKDFEYRPATVREVIKLRTDTLIRNNTEALIAPEKLGPVDEVLQACAINRQRIEAGIRYLQSV